MRRTIWLLAGVLLSVVALGSDSPKEYDDATEIDFVHGTWRLTELTDGKRPVDLEFQMEITFCRGAYTINFIGDDDPWRGSYHIDPARKPSHLNLIPSDGIFKGKLLKFLCQINGDTLVVAGIPGENFNRRPESFSDQELLLATYKRVKK